MNYGWQLDSDLWNLIPADLRDSQSWQFVGFTEIEAVSVPEGKSGIYLFCTSPVGKRLLPHIHKKDLFSNLYTPIYIGKTKDLQRRFLEHCKHPSASIAKARRCYGSSMLFWFHSREDDQINEDEARLIQCFGPPANERRETIKGIVREAISIGIHDQ